MPDSSTVTHDPDLVKAKRDQYKSILSDLAQLDSENDASRVLNYNKREVLQLLEQVRGQPAAVGRGGETPVPGWLAMETMVGAVAASRPSGRLREQAITSLGHLFYLAGAQMTSVLDDSLEALLAVLRDAESPEQRRLLAVKALAEVCWGSQPAQQRLHARGGVQALVDCVCDHRHQPSVARWACHSLTVLLADSEEIWRFLRQLEPLERALTQLALDEALWAHWDNNQAAILHGLLFGPHSIQK